MTSDQAHDDWRPCAIGDLQKYRVTQGASRRAARAAPWLALAFTAALVTFTWWGVQSTWTKPGPLPAGPSLTCREVMELLPEYRNRQLSNDLQEQVTHHLAKCPPCRAAFNQLAAKGCYRSEASPNLLARLP